jgi:hypothetical protein
MVLHKNVTNQLLVPQVWQPRENAKARETYKDGDATMNKDGDATMNKDGDATINKEGDAITNNTEGKTVPLDQPGLPASVAGGQARDSRKRRPCAGQFLPLCL